MTSQAALPHVGYDPRNAFVRRFAALCDEAGVAMPALDVIRDDRFAVVIHVGLAPHLAAWVWKNGDPDSVAARAFAKWMRR